MKQIFLSLLMFLCTAVPQAKADLANQLQLFQLYTSCTPIGLAVGDLPEDAKKINLTEKAIRSSVESRLLSGRIFNDNKFPYLLYVNINIVGNAFSIRLNFIKSVKDYFFPELIGPATS